MTKKDIRKGDIYFANLDPVVGSEQGGERPVVVLQNNYANKYSPTVIIAPLTKVLKKRNLKEHIFVETKNILKYDSQILLEQIRTLDKKRFINYLGKINDNQLQIIENALIKIFEIDIVRYLKKFDIGGLKSMRKTKYVVSMITKNAKIDVNIEALNKKEAIKIVEEMIVRCNYFGYKSLEDFKLNCRRKVMELI